MTSPATRDSATPGALEESRGRRLLVVTDRVGGGGTALALPFRDATVVLAAADGSIDAAGEFDAVAFDLGSTDLEWLDRAARSSTRRMRPGGHLIVVLPVGDAAPGDRTYAPALVGWRWQGLSTLAGRPCAVLLAAQPGDNTAESGAGAGALLATADAATRLALAHAMRDGDGARQANREAIAELAEWRRGEEAMLDRIDMLVDELEGWRRRQGFGRVRALLRRRRAGRALLRILGPVRRRWRRT